MRRSILITSLLVLLLGTLSLVVIFGSALAQPLFPARHSQAPAQDGITSCHLDATDGSSDEHMRGLLAEALGMNEADLRANLGAGNSIQDIAKARGFDDARLAEAIKGGMQGQMQQHVEDGFLSQTVADEMLTHMARMDLGHLTNMLNGNMPDMMNGQDHGNMMGGTDGANMMEHPGMGTTMGDVNYDNEDGQYASCHIDDYPATGSF